MTPNPLPLIDTPSTLLVGVPAFCECLAEIVEETWSGTAYELFDRLCAVAAERKLDVTCDAFWPNTAAEVLTAYTSYADILEQLGIYRRQGNARMGQGGTSKPVAHDVPPTEAAAVEARRITFLRDGAAASRRSRGSGSLEVRDPNWVGVWVGGQVRVLGRLDALTRVEALELMNRGVPASRQRAAGTNGLSVSQGRWRGSWRRDGKAITRVLGLVSEMTRLEAEDILAGEPPPRRRRAKGTGVIYMHQGAWRGRWTSAGEQHNRTFGRITELSREEAEGRLAAAIAASKSREPDAWSPFDAIRRVAAE